MPNSCSCRKYTWSISPTPPIMPVFKLQWVDCYGRLHQTANLSQMSGTTDCSVVNPRLLVGNRIFRNVVWTLSDCCCSCYSFEKTEVGCTARIRDCITGQFRYISFDPDTTPNVCSSITPLSRCSFPIEGNPCVLDQITNSYICVNLTTTTTLPPINLMECDVLLMSNTAYLGNNQFASQQIFIYNSGLNSLTLLNPYISGLVSGPSYSFTDIAHTLSYIWIIAHNSNLGISEIHEYQIISTYPFSATYVRTLSLPFGIGGLCAKDNTTLIGFNDNTFNPVFCTPNNIVEIDISGISPIITYPNINSPNNRIFVGGDLMYTTNGKLLTSTFNCYTYDNYLTQYDYTTQVLEVDVLDNDMALGIYQEQGEIYLINQGGVVQNISQNYPYKITDITTIYFNNVQYAFDGASQNPTCCIASLIP